MVRFLMMHHQDKFLGKLINVFWNSAIVAAPHEKWGETPVAYIVIKKNRILNEETIIKHCRENLAGYKVIQEKKKKGLCIGVYNALLF
jgi:hypothetical protein